VRQRWQSSGREVSLDDDPETDPPSQFAMAGEKIENGQVSEAVQAAIGALPMLQREALVLFEFEELSLEQVAAVAGCDAGTVKSRLHRARARLRRVLAPCWNQMHGGRGPGTVEPTDRPQKTMVCGTHVPCPTEGVCHEPAE
jgi:DNA-directed RNA polymerase specialized sigma24 family protein